MREYHFRIILKNGSVFDERVTAHSMSIARDALRARYPDAREINWQS